MGHSNASYAEAAAGFRAGAKGITHLFNAMSGFHHREPGLAGFGLMHDEIYVEIIGDPFHLHHEVLRMIFTLKNPERILLISDSVKDTHASSAQAAVTAANGTLLGGGMALMEAARFLEQLGIHWDTIVKSISDNPERYLSL
jgi:N-acetylglucosamine-6-phosphate deacetylase